MNDYLTINQKQHIIRLLECGVFTVETMMHYKKLGYGFDVSEGKVIDMKYEGEM